MVVGGTLDMLTGRVRRAPRLIQRMGLEWAWRLSREPRRLWRRYLVDDTQLARYLWREWRARRRARGTTP
jgi:N-acetylglucosaminyldiphosphoundecaprenol N-acetyl-beta-D-mannosaminyltransferase